MLSAGSESAPQEQEQAQAQEQARVHFRIPGSKGPLGLLTVTLAQDNVSEGGYDGSSRARAGMFTLTPRLATMVLSVPLSNCACVRVVRVVWAVRVGFEWLAWMEAVGRRR